MVYNFGVEIPPGYNGFLWYKNELLETYSLLATLIPANPTSDLIKY